MTSLPDVVNRRRFVPRPLLWVFAVLFVVSLVGMFAFRHHSASPSTVQGGNANVTVNTATGRVAVPGSGPAGTTAGVPVGYAQTETGAQAAGTNYAVALSGAGMFAPGTRHAVITAIADPQMATTLTATLDAAFSSTTGRFGLDDKGQAPSGRVFVARSFPAGVRTVSYSAEVASVAVWVNALVGVTGAGSTMPVQESWSTMTVVLHWVDGDWRFAGYSGSDGPTPVGANQAPTSPDQLAGQVAGFGGLRYATAG